MFKLSELYNTQLSSIKVIGYHSTDDEIDVFDHDELTHNPQSSTFIDGIFFSNVPQKSWGSNTYKATIISQNPAKFNLNTSRFDSMGVQEAFDALLRGETSYMLSDLIEYGGYDNETANQLVEAWSNLDLIIIYGVQYAEHTIEYIVPDPYYNGNSAKIINMGKI
jgi:hypothetical protein